MLIFGRIYVSKYLTAFLRQEKFSKSFQLNPLASGLSDLETGKYIEINKAFCDLLGFNKKEILEIKLIKKAVKEVENA